MLQLGDGIGGKGGGGTNAIKTLARYRPGTTLPLRQLFRGFICVNGFPTGQVKVDPA